MSQPSSNSMNSLPEYLGITEQELSAIVDKLKSFLISTCEKAIKNAKRESLPIGEMMKIRMNKIDLFKSIKEHFSEKERDIVLMLCLSKDCEHAISEASHTIGKVKGFEIDPSDISKLKNAKSFEELMNILKK